MTLLQAWQSGARALTRYPWLALIPAAINLLLAALVWNAIPLGPILDVNLLADRSYYYEPLFGSEDQSYPISPESNGPVGES